MGQDQNRVKILCVDDDQDVLDTYESIFSKDLGKEKKSFFTKKTDETTSEHVEFYSASSGEEALGLFKNHFQSGDPFYLVFLDIRMPPGINGVETAKIIHQIDPLAEIVLLSAYNDYDYKTIVEEVGNSKNILFFEKPFEIKNIIRLVQSLSYRSNENRSVDENLHKQEKCLLENHYRDSLFKYSSVNWNLLIEGETGTGKRSLAELVHLKSNLKEFPFLEYDCSNIEMDKVWDEIQEVSKKNQESIVGTLLFRNVDELQEEQQTKLLNFIDKRNLSPAQRSTALFTEYRLIFATSKSLLSEIDQNRFRKDLYFRLRSSYIRMTSLSSDSSFLRELILDMIAQKQQLFGKKELTLANDALRMLIGYSWPGNIRELDNVLNEVVLGSRGGTIGKELIPVDIKKGAVTKSFEEYNLPEEEIKDRLIKLLKENGGNRESTAKTLGISRTTLYRYMKKYDIKFNKPLI